MKLRRMLCAALCTVGVAGSASAVDLLTESFETDGQGVRYVSTAEFLDTSSDHWGRTDGSNISNTTGAYTSADGSFFWAAEDVDDPDGNTLLTQTLLIENIDISGHENLSFSGLFGAGNESVPGASAYDEADVFMVQYRIDADDPVAYTDGICFSFEAPADPGDVSNEPIGLDADCDGASDGVSGRLGTQLQEFVFSIAGTGSTLDLLVTVSVNAGNEEVAFDDLVISGDVVPSGPTALLVETFETDGQGVRYTSTTEFLDTASDHWGRTDGSNIGNTTGAYTAIDGTFFWAAEDVDDPDGNGLLIQTVEFPNINISGFNNLTFTGLFGAGNENGPGASAYDATDMFMVQYRIDADDPVAYSNGVCFSFEVPADPGDTSNEPIGLDADCDGESDGVAGRLGTALQEFGFDILETGNTLDLLVTVSVNSGNEEVAFDNLMILGESSGLDLPPQVTTTVPADMAVGVAIDSNVTINFSESVDILTDAIEIDCAISGIQTAPPSPILGTTAVEANIADFANNEVCTVTIDRLLILDNDGTPDPMDENAVFSFTTVQDFAPEVISTVPADGSVGFVNTDDLMINFSESIDATVDGASMICSVSGKVSFNGLPANDTDVLTLDPVVDLVDGETCNLTIAAAEVTDNDGNADNMTANVVVFFTVGFPQVEIFEIQGAGLASPYDGLVVATNDNIVTALDTNGFYMQTPDARDDGDVMTSNGIFVFTGGAPTVAVGDQIDLTGEVVEFFDLTEFTNPGSYILNVDSSGNPLPTAVLLDDNFPPTDPTQFPCVDEALGYECVEGMLFDMPQGFISAAYVSFFGANRDDQLVKAGSSRAFREPGIDYPGLAGLPVFDGNPELLEMDVDALGLDLAANSYAAGTEVAISGVFGFDFGEYEIWPSSINVINENVIPGAVRDAATDEVTLASANLFRLFNAIDDPGPEDDDQIADPLEYADRLSKLARYFVDDMKAPTIIALQEIENISVLQDLTAAIANYGGPTYVSTMVEGNDQGGIDVAYLYQAGMLSNVQITQLGAGEINTFDGSLLHDRPPLRLSADVNLSQSSLAINVLVVHMRSRGGIDDAVDGERVRSKRLQQANSVASMVDAILTEAPNVGLYVLGDFNAFQFTDGYVDVVGQITGEAVEADNLVWEAPLFAANPLTQAVQTLTADQQYSFIFRGSAQVLDNAIMNDKGLMNLVDMQYARGQADSSLEPELDGSTSLRSTDHDGFVLFIYEDNDLIFENGFE